MTDYRLQYVNPGEIIFQEVIIGAPGVATVLAEVGSNDEGDDLVVDITMGGMGTDPDTVGRFIDLITQVLQAVEVNKEV